MLTIFFAGGLITSILALKTGSVTLLLILRNLMPLCSLLVERQLLPLSSTRPITLESVLALTLLASGTALYAFRYMTNGGATHALGWIVLNIVTMVSYRLAERRVLWDMPRALSFGALNLMQNFFGLIPVVILFFAWGEHRTLSEHSYLLKLDHWRDPMTSVCILFSGSAGVALGYYSTMLQKEVTATTMLALQSIMKVAVIFLAMVVLHEHLGHWSAIGCGISLVGGAWYAWVISKPELQKGEVESSEDDPLGTKEVKQ